LGGNDKAMNVCPECGGRLKKGVGFCSGCGLVLSRGKDKIKKTAGRGNSIIIAGFVVLFGLLYLALAIKPEKTTAGETQNQRAGVPEDMAQYQSMIDRLPEEYEKLVAMGNRLMDDGSYPLAVEAYQKALAIDSTDPDVITDLGACYHALGGSEMAAQMFEKAIALKPDHGIAYFNLGIAYRDLGRFDKVRHYWGKLIEMYPDQPIADTVKKYIENLDNN